MSENKKIKSVSFNKKNEKDKKILKHIARRNFSGYVKKLILADIERKEPVKSEVMTEEIEKEVITMSKKSIYDVAQIKKEEINSPLIQKRAEESKVKPARPFIPKRN
ncbi:hypothetical protein [Sutcliffiella sp. NC1]|uniref:hypothetical protein n=1 Tax=Sutcliffiella sp. NC1 TaxID=3004096 RepID=UPI0022DDB729|nr:hypothetical protein [Sutcliffiella sp. NC1]WBL16387.1 hypothetical protein O1A01_07070 [Sutcliffiella sp. NC1]